jgi:hypothetical protein
VREWVTVHTFSEDQANPATVSFALTVAGEPAGTASLEIDSSGLLVVRRQIQYLRKGVQVLAGIPTLLAALLRIPLVREVRVVAQMAQIPHGGL